IPLVLRFWSGLFGIWRFGVWTLRSASRAPPDPLLLVLALLFQPGALALELCADLLDLVGIPAGLRLGHALLQEDFPFRDLPFVDRVDLGQPRLLGGGESLGR